jgi:protease-4
MSGIFTKMREDKRKLALALIIVFLSGWFSFAYYLYTNQILVIPIEGSITDFQFTTLALHQGKIDENVKAIILYFNTPGGLAYTCLEIAKYVRELAAIKPVIAVMGPTCASGGYYISSFADYIFTHENTITGSVGVIAVWVDMSEYYEKEGINITVWTTGSEKDFGADWRPPTKEEFEQINASVQSIFQKLLADIQQNRHLTQANLELIKTGGTFLGSEAIELGLADEVGDIINALEEVVKRTGLWKFIIVSPYMDVREKILRSLFW